MRAHIAYLKYILKHKYFVFLACRKLHVSLYHAVIHDCTKFLPAEWFPYLHTFYKSDGSSQYIETPEFNRAWNYHQKRNKHYWQYWLLKFDDGRVLPIKMPEKYANEMVADWIGAGKAITGKIDVWSWYEKNKNIIELNEKTRDYVEDILIYFELKTTHNLKNI